MKWISTNLYTKAIINNLDSLFFPLRIAGFDLDDTLTTTNKKNLEINFIDYNLLLQKFINLLDRKYIFCHLCCKRL